MHIPIKFVGFRKLSEDKKIEYVCQSFGDKVLFKNILNSFLREYGHRKLINVTVDRYGIGEVPAVVVTIKQGQSRTSFPKSYMGLPVVTKKSQESF